MDPPQNSFTMNKQLKEEFVSNLTGSTVLEVGSLSTIIPAFILLRRFVHFKSICDPVHTTGRASKNKDSINTDCRKWRVYMIELTMDFFFIILPMLLFLTVLAEWTHLCAICLIVPMALCIRNKRYGSSSYSKREQDPAYSIRTDISAYRVSLMIATCLCILAVDFKIFPRRYAKTETYGTSLMDLGVGSFVLANSLVSRQARNISSSKWKAALQSTSPLIVLGVGRLIFTTGVDYQVHVGEYGVHWNFFFTLAAVSILSSIINIHPQYSGFLGSLILVGYQICLICGLNEFLVSKERANDIISQNKEGIFSIFGYWGMYLIGVQLGNYLFFEHDSRAMKRNNQRARTRVWFLAFMFWSLTFILDSYVERVSRRMCNLAYVTFVLAQSFQFLSSVFFYGTKPFYAKSGVLKLFMKTECVSNIFEEMQQMSPATDQYGLAILMLSDFFPGQKASVLEGAFSRNLLAIFLLANVLTGLINMYVNTLFVSSITALAILVGYAFVLSVLAGFAELSGLKLKFW